MKKISLHMDALIFVILLFILSFGFNFYQHHQYADLLREHTGIQLKIVGMEFTKAMDEGRLKECASPIVLPAR